MQYLKRHGLWRALYGARPVHDDWWHWLVMQLAKTPKGRRLVNRQFRAETARIIDAAVVAGKLTNEAAARLKRSAGKRAAPSDWAKALLSQDQSLETSLRYMQWYGRPEGNEADQGNWLGVRCFHPVHWDGSFILSAEGRTEMWRQMFPRPVMERLLAVNGVEAP